MPNFKSFDLDVTQWIEIEQRPNHHTWRNSSVASDVMAQGLTYAPPTDLPKTYPDIRDKVASHPLTRVHRYLYDLPLSIQLGFDVKRAKPYRP